MIEVSQDDCEKEKNIFCGGGRDSESSDCQDIKKRDVLMAYRSLVSGMY